MLSSLDRALIFAHFEDHIKNCKVPVKKECEDFVLLKKVRGLEWSQVKDVVNARIQKEKRKK
jgi:hypothetical protein